MRQSNRGSGQSFRAEDFRPLVEGQIGGHVIALAEDLEEQFRAGPGYCKARLHIFLSGTRCRYQATASYAVSPNSS